MGALQPPRTSRAAGGAWSIVFKLLPPAGTNFASDFAAAAAPTTALQAAPVVVVGADDGTVSAYSLAGMYDAEAAAAAACTGGGGCSAWEQEQRQRLEAALRHHTSQQVSD
jgi:hypothetical protein